MDGISLTAPYSESEQLYQQMTLFDFMDGTKEKGETIPCRIYDWRANRSLEFREMMKGV